MRSDRRFIYDVSARTQYLIQVNAYTETYTTPSRVTPSQGDADPPELTPNVIARG